MVYVGKEYQDWKIDQESTLLINFLFIFFSFIKRLELEVDHCRKQQPFQIQVGPVRRDSLADAMEQAEEEAAAAARGITLGNY